MKSKVESNYAALQNISKYNLTAAAQRNRERNPNEKSSDNK